ncbi:hypothetical protein [Dactylosporangium sp. CA-233914]|uniref:hypothetical protein n=1 Tax=Dactylosporangium sp. CA-233914 TaxID=3239934 RepID=UPI003D8C2F12
MQRWTTRAMTPAERAGAVVAAVLCAGLSTVGALILLGVVPVAGWGAGTLAGKAVCGGLFTVLGLAGLAGAVSHARSGRVTVAPDAPSPDPFPAFGLGIDGPGGREPHSGGEL